MIHRTRLAATALVALFCGTLVLADTLESVEKAIVEKVTGYTSLQCKVVNTHSMQSEQMKTEGQAETTFEFLKKGDKWLYRGEGKHKGVTVVQGQEQKIEGTILTICDGEFLYTLSEGNGQKMAMKNRMPDEPMMLTNQAYFDGLKKEYDLKLLPDETVDGKATWVIEAKAKQSIPGGPATLVSYFDKSNGMNIKIVGKDPGGKTVLTATTSDIKINPPLKPERFVFKAPEGVEVMDLTKQGEPAAETKPGAEPAEKKEGEKKPEDAPKKPDKPKKPELPKLPKKP